MSKVFTKTEFSSLIPCRKADSHKGDYGRVTVVAGSQSYIGAPFFAAMGAVRTGSGIVTLAVPEPAWAPLAIKVNEPIFRVLPAEGGCIAQEAADIVIKYAKNQQAVLIGPGLGRGEAVTNAVLKMLCGLQTPIVIDADGLNALAGHIDILQKTKYPAVLTPHDGEFARLTQRALVPEERAESARRFAIVNRCILLLKGHRTLIASPEGKMVYNSTGNPGMAKGGSGDVLAGIILSLIGQGLEPFQAAAAGAYLHGSAGDLCANELGEYGMTPTDMLSYIPRVLLQYNSREW